MTAVHETVTQWIEQVKEGDSGAAQLLWQRYFDRMIHLARRRLEATSRAMADEEDVALSAFKSFCLGARNGKFPKLTDRNSLWSLLVAITVHKSIDLIRRENRRKRGGTGKARGDDLAGSPPLNEAPSLSEIVKHEPTPEFAAQIGDQFERLIKRLDDADDADLIVIAVLKMQGESTVDIARQMGCVRRTVERKLRLIRSLWEKECVCWQPPLKMT